MRMGAPHPAAASPTPKHCAAQIVCNNQCCPSGKKGCRSGSCTQCDEDSDCTGTGEKCCNGQCVADGDGNYGANCCGAPGNTFTGCAQGSLKCSSTSSNGTCVCDDTPGEALLHPALRTGVLRSAWTLVLLYTPSIQHCLSHHRLATQALRNGAATVTSAA